MNSLLIFFFSFFTPNIKLNSGKTLKFKGKGPPLLFSTGLYGTMPNFIYSNIQNKLLKNFTLIINPNYNSLSINDINNLVNELQVDYIGLFSHSSFNDKLLECKYFNKITLCDPITTPNFQFNGFSKKKILPKCDISIIRAEKLYRSDLTIPDYQTPFIKKNKIKSDIIYQDVGHPDILDNYWANLAIYSSLWKGIEIKKKINKYNDWKLENLNKNNIYLINKMREEYRTFIAKETINFHLN